MIATLATQAQPGALRNRGGSAACTAYTSARAMTVVVPVVTTVVAAGTMPVGMPAVVFVAKAASSRRSFASASKRGNCCPKSVSSNTSYDPYTHAAAFEGVTTTFATVGEPSVTIVASASHAAFTPALLTPFHVELVVCLMLLIRRQGLALPAFVRMIVGSSTNGSKYPPFALVRVSAARAEYRPGSDR